MERAKRPLLDWQQDSANLMHAYRPDGKWACRTYVEWCPRQNGKGLPLEARVLMGLFVLGEELMMWSAHEYKTALEMFIRVSNCVRALAGPGGQLRENLYLVDGVRIRIAGSHGEEGIYRLDPIMVPDPNKAGEFLQIGASTARLKFIARTKASGRGFSGDLNIIDESFSFEDAEQAALQPTMSARPNPQIIYASTPPLTGTSAPVMYRLRDRNDPTIPRQRGATFKPRTTIGYRDWGASGDLDHLEEFDPEDEAAVEAANPSYGKTALGPEGVQEERDSMSRVDFARERFGIWPKRIDPDRPEGGDVDMDRFGAIQLQLPEIVRPRKVAFAVVVNAQRTKTVIAACGLRPDGKRQVSLVDVRAGTKWVPDRLLQLQEKVKPTVIAIQDKGPSATVLLDVYRQGLQPMKDREKPYRGDIVNPWAADVASAYGLFVDAMSDLHDSLRHLGEPELILSAQHATTRPLGSGTAWDYKLETSAEINAVTLAHWADLTFTDIVKERDGDTGVWVV